MPKKEKFPFWKSLFIFTVFAIHSCQSSSEKTERIQLLQNDQNKSVEVLIEGKLFTAYIYPESIKKPVLYPILSPKGSNLTRKFPMESAKGERVDHPHHVGLWFNYGDVNGLDFWNNSDSIKVEKRSEYGTIVHQEIVSAENGDKEARLTVKMNWLNPKNEVLLNEKTTFIFRGEGDEYAIDRITRLTAPNEAILFKDNKEGVLGIRVTRKLEHPTSNPEIFTDSNGIPNGVPVLNNEGVNGNYLNKEGIQGTDCWGIRSDWVNLRSSIGEEEISLAILDHQENIGYPTYWHARGYGLFAANPLGQEVFSDGKEKLNFLLAKGESVTFRHRILVASKNLSKEALDAQSREFSETSFE